MPSKSHKRAKHRVKPTDTTVARRSSRTRKPPKYAQNYYSSRDTTTKPSDAVLSEFKIKRKVSKQETARNTGESNSVESPVNALSDALYSDTSLDRLSGVVNSQNIPPPKTTQVKKPDSVHAV